MGKKVKGVVAYKRALLSARAIQKDSSLMSEKAEQFISDITPFLTKKGEVRKNLSKAKREAFNKLVSDYSRSKASSKSKLKKAKAKQLQSAIQEGTYQNEAEQNKNIELFKNDAIKSLIDEYGFGSSQVNKLAISFFDVSDEIIEQAAEMLLDKLDNRTPEEAKQVLTQSDAYKMLEQFIKDIQAPKDDNNEDDKKDDEQ